MVAATDELRGEDEIVDQLARVLHTRLLHDGRADGVEEAVLWHGGEAARPRVRFMALSRRERAQLVAFVEDL